MENKPTAIILAIFLTGGLALLIYWINVIPTLSIHYIDNKLVKYRIGDGEEQILYISDIPSNYQSGFNLVHKPIKNGDLFITYEKADDSIHFYIEDKKGNDTFGAIAYLKTGTWTNTKHESGRTNNV